MNGKQLKNSILQWAIQGKLVPQDPNDEPASVLLERIRAEKTKLIKEKKIKKDKNESIIYRGEDNSYYEKLLATGEVKCIDDEIPFEIPQGWEWCRMGGIIELLSGQDFMPEKYNSKNQGIPYITGASSISNGKLIINRWTECPSVIGKLGDLLIVCKGSGVGKMCFCNVEKIHIARQIQIIRGFSSFICMSYLKLIIDANLSAITSNAQGVIPGISREHILNLIIPIPPFNAQQHIIKKLKLLQPLIQLFDSKQEELNNLDTSIKELLKKSILQEAIQGKLVPQIAEEGIAQELLEQIRQEKQELVKEGKLKKSTLIDSVIYKGDDNKYYEQVGKKCLDITEQIPFEIPENWVWTRLGQIGDWGAGSTPQRGNANYYNGNILWLKTGELNNGIVYDTEEKITQKAFQDCSLRINRIGDVLIAMYGATIGKLAVVGKELTTNQACCGCTPYLIYNWYLFYFLMASRDTFIKKGEGGAQPNISRVKLVEHLIPLPPIKEQQRIVAQIEKLFEQLR